MIPQEHSEFFEAELQEALEFMDENINSIYFSMALGTHLTEETIINEYTETSPIL